MINANNALYNDIFPNIIVTTCTFSVDLKMI